MAIFSLSRLSAFRDHGLPQHDPAAALVGGAVVLQERFDLT